MSVKLSTEGLSVGYGRKPLIEDIAMRIGDGEIVTLIGPNGAGKSTILKTLTRHLQKIRGSVAIIGEDVSKMSDKKFAEKVSVVLTDRIKADRMTCEEVAAAGRYPYTDFFGRLTEKDRGIVEDSLKRVGVWEFKDRQFDSLSDGQRQRVMLARAICQQPQVLVLDEPTSFLDIKHKIELLDILRELAKEHGVSILLSLHEIDLAAKISDTVICVADDGIRKVGAPQEVFCGDTIKELYNIENGEYNLVFGSVELKAPQGKPSVFVLAGGGAGISVYRALQRRQIPFSTGILCENDIDYQVAKALAETVISIPAFEMPSEESLASAMEEIRRAGALYVAPQLRFGTCNAAMRKLIGDSALRGIAILEDPFAAKAKAESFESDAKTAAHFEKSDAKTAAPFEKNGGKVGTGEPAGGVMPALKSLQRAEDAEDESKIRTI